LGAFGSLSNRAVFTFTTPIRIRNLNHERSAATFLRIETALSFWSYKLPSHSRSRSRSICPTAGASPPGGVT